jgi:CRISPR type III-B/RAMP module-associated protein Cmr5
MNNLEQVRAKNALKATGGQIFGGKDGGEIAKKIPTMIRDYGLMATLAFALEKKKKDQYANEGFKLALDCVVGHLRDPLVQRLPDTIKDAEAWMNYLANEADSAQLRDQTAEAMAYLSYFRRFATKG